MKKRIVFIINPISGIIKKENVIALINSNIDKSKFDHSIQITQAPGHAIEICKMEVSKDADIIVAVGGDGSINEIAQGLKGSDVQLGIIPAGSGNGLAHHLKIPINIRKAIAVINKDNCIKIDTASINNRLFVSIAGVGFDGLVAKKFAKSNRRGFITYLKIVTEEYPKYRPRKYTIRINDKKIETKALFITFANSSQFGYNTAFTPYASVDDGLLDICIMGKPPIIKIPILASLLYSRKIDKSRYVQILRAKEFTVTSKKRRWVNIDGEPMKLDKKLVVKVMPLSLGVVVP